MDYYTPIIKGIMVAGFIMATTDLNMTNLKWWIATITMCVMVNI